METNNMDEITVTACLHASVPFAMYAFPGEKRYNLIAMLPDADGNCVAHLDNESWNGFAINFFGNDEPYTAGIEVLPESLLVLNNSGLCQAAVKPSFRSTPRMHYKAVLHNVISGLKKRGGKVVISQLTAVASARNLMDVLNDYFERFPETFRYICFTPETGIWLGATPELLIDYDLATGELSTMALAGTRSAEASGQWDKKNLEEHYMVVDFIREALISLGMNVEAGDLSEVKFGDIVHLCTPIKATGNVNPVTILEYLSPTPALCGYPREDAVRDIIINEYHERLCYGGYVAVKTGSRIRAFANLRCAFLAPGTFDDGTPGWLYNIYSGGGITALSRIDDEWEEAMAKCRPLLESVTGQSVPARNDSDVVTGFSLSC